MQSLIFRVMTLINTTSNIMNEKGLEKTGARYFRYIRLGDATMIYFSCKLRCHEFTKVMLCTSFFTLHSG